VQKDGRPEQRPPSQYPEQQSSCFWHALPAVEQLVFKGTQLPAPASPAAPQLPLQHSSLLVHGWLSEMQVVAPHFPPLQTIVQHSGAAEHDAPASLQGPTDTVQMFEAGSQLAEQQSLWLEQVAPTSLQSGLTSACGPSVAASCDTSAPESPAAPPPPPVA
jgi:hypothetical protein